MSVINTRPVLSIKRTGVTNAVTSAVNMEDGQGRSVADFSIEGISTISIMTATTTNIVGAQVLTLQVSNDGSNWVASGITVTPNATAPNAAFSATAGAAICAKRARLVTAAAITSGVYNVFIQGR